MISKQFSGPLFLVSNVHVRRPADAAAENRFARASEKGETVRQSISLSNLAGLRNVVCQSSTDRGSPLLNPSSPLLTPDDTCETTAVTPRIHGPLFERSPSAPPESYCSGARGWELPAVSPNAASIPLRSHAILSEPPGSTTPAEAFSPGTVTPRPSTAGAPAYSESWGFGGAMSNLAASPSLSHAVWAWLGGHPAIAADAASAPLPPSSPPPHLVRSASEAPPRGTTPRSQGPFGTADIPVARYHAPPPGCHENFWPQTPPVCAGSAPGTPAELPLPGLGSLRCQSSCTPRSQPIDCVVGGTCESVCPPHDSLLPQSPGLSCRTRGPQDILPRPQSAPSGSPFAGLPASPSAGLWAARQWASLSQAVRGVTSVESASMVSEPAVTPRRPSSIVKPLQSYPLAIVDFEGLLVWAEAVGANEARPSGVSVAPPSMFTSLVSAVFGQEPAAAAEAPAAPVDAGRSPAGVFQMPEGAREGNSSTAEIIQHVPDRMMHELGAIFDEAWAVRDSRSSVVGVGEGSLLGPASRGAAGCTVERMWSHNDRTLNVSFVLDRHHLRDGLFAYRSRLRMYGSCPGNACTFLLRDDVIRSGNPSMLMYDRLDMPAGECGGEGPPHMACTGYPESGILHSCFSMPGFLKTRQYIACRRVWKWDDKSQCLIVSIPFAHPDVKELCKGKGSLAEDYRMGYIVRFFPLTKYGDFSAFRYSVNQVQLDTCLSQRRSRPPVSCRPFTDEEGAGAEICTVCYENFGVVPFVANGLAQATLWSTSKTFVSHFRKFEEAIAMAGSSGDVMATFQEVQAVHANSSTRKRSVSRKISLCVLGSIGSGLLGMRMCRGGR